MSAESETTHGPLFDTLARLVHHPSISLQPMGDLTDYLSERARSAGFSVERHEVGPGRSNLVCRRGPRSETGDGLLLSGHMDVVPVEGQHWSTDPFKLTQRDGLVYGRGTCDMKGFLAAATEACDRLSGTKLSRELVLVWTCDEEIGCEGSRALVAQLSRGGDSGLPDPSLPRATVIGEPTSFRICRLHPGHTTFRVICTGRPAHSSRPELGLSAIRLATRVLIELEALEDELRQERGFEEDLPSPYPVLNTALIQGGTAVNIIPDRCEIRLGLRQLPGQAAEDLHRRLEDRLATLARKAEQDGGSIQVELVQSSPSLLTNGGCAHLPLLQAHASDPRPTGAPFATDGGNLALLGLEPLVFGPGSIDVAHRPDEHLALGDLHHTVDIILDLVRRRCLAAG